MDDKDYLDIIPRQQTGWQVNAESHRDFSSEQEAHRFYGIAKKRLLDVNQWQHFAGKLSARFQLMDGNGQLLNRPAQKGDYFKLIYRVPVQ